MNPGIELKVFNDLSYGLYILTSFDQDRKNGQIINTAVQVTADPLQVEVIVNRNNLTHEYIQKSGLFAVSVLDESTPFPFIGLFGFKSGRETDKLAQVKHEEGMTGCPLVTDHALSFFEAKVTANIDVGSHTIFIGHPVRSEVLSDGKPLTYQYYCQVMKGKSPPNAPTFRPANAIRISMK